MSAIDHPAHYNSHPAGIECIEIARWFPFSYGNAIKYLWRAGLKGAAAEDLQKARWYVLDAKEKRGPGWDLSDHLQDGLLEQACGGFENPLVGSAIMHIAHDQWDMALKCINALINSTNTDHRGSDEGDASAHDANLEGSPGATGASPLQSQTGT